MTLRPFSRKARSKLALCLAYYLMPFSIRTGAIGYVPCPRFDYSLRKSNEGRKIGLYASSNLMKTSSGKEYKTAPQRSQVLEVLRKMKPILKEKYGVTHLGIFGSVARDEATESSDVDVVMEIEVPNLFTSVNIKEDLEAELGIPVDLVQYRERMNTYLKARIEKDAVYV